MRSFWAATTWLFDRIWVISAFVCLLLAVFLALSDRVAAGTLLAALFIVLFVFHKLPQIEYFKALGVEAKLRARLSEADEILKKLRLAAKAQAQFLFHEFGWGSRFGGLKPAQKQQIVDATEASLRELAVSDDEIAVMKRDYLRFAALDQFQNFCGLVDVVISHNLRAMGASLNAIGDKDDAQYQELQTKLDALKELRGKHGDPLDDIVNNGALARFSEHCREQIPADLLPDKDVELLMSFAEKISTSVDRCLSAGRIDDESAELVEHRRGEDLFRELFGEKPNM